MRDMNLDNVLDKAGAIKGAVAYVDGRALGIGAHTSVIALLIAADQLCTRRSVSGEPRFALCGMGVCQECRVTIDGRAQRLACQTTCRPGMRIVTGENAE